MRVYEGEGENADVAWNGNNSIKTVKNRWKIILHGSAYKGLQFEFTMDINEVRGNKKYQRAATGRRKQKQG